MSYSLYEYILILVVGVAFVKTINFKYLSPVPFMVRINISYFFGNLSFREGLYEASKTGTQ